MKKLTNAIVNDNNQDVIIEYFMKENKNSIGKIDWLDEKNNIAKCHGDARVVTVLLSSQDNPRNITAIDIRASQIKKLYQEIIEIENLRSEEFID